MDIIRMSLSASVLIVAVVIIRALILHKLPKKTLLILWGIVIYRLLVPFSISCRFSFYTGMDRINHLFSERTAITAPAGKTGIQNISNIPMAKEAIEAGTSILSISPIEIVWLIGICTSVLFFIIVYVKCRREFNMSLPVENNFAIRWLQEHPLRRPVQIRQSDRIKTPLTYGVFHPVILLPKKTDWMDETRLRYILTHEFTHIRHFDTLIKLVLTVTVCVHWFNPFIWVMYVLANRDIELSCDETVVRTFGETIKSAYALALIGLEEKKSRLTPLVNNFSKNAIEERIVSIMKLKKTSLLGIGLALVLVVLTATVFATNAAAANNPATDSSGITREASSSVVISSKDASGKLQISNDNGKTWMSEEEYDRAYPTPEVEWWTYDEYKEWLDNEKIQLQNMIGEKGYNPTDGWYVWTQEMVDETIKMYEGFLEDIKNGMKLSKTVDGSSDQVIMSNYTSDIEITSGYIATIINDKGKEAQFGPYGTKKELLDKIRPYCEKQVKAGNMTQQEADEILSKYN